MTIHPADIKRTARTALLGHWGEQLPFAALLIALTLTAGAVLSLFSVRSVSALLYRAVLALILQLLLGLFGAGAALHFLNLLRGRETSLKDLLVPFRVQPDRYLIAGFLELLAGLLLYAPASFSDVIGMTLGLAGRGTALLAVACFAGGTLLYLPVRAAFSMSRYLLLDHPEMGALESVRESFRMMKGQKGRFVVLLLSFLGYLLLSLCTAGIALMWVIPYIYTSVSRFYLILSDTAQPLREEGAPAS